MVESQVSRDRSVRHVLEGVPWVGFYRGGKRCPEDMPLASVLRACLEYLGEADYGCNKCRALNPDCKVNCTYAHLLGITGAAFFLSWKKGWHRDNTANFYLSKDAKAQEQRAFEAIGYQYEVLTKDGRIDQEWLFRQRILESIQRGMPVLAYGVIGPPEPSLVTGYDEGGDVILGWSFFQDFQEVNAGVEFEPSGYFRKRDWYQDTESLLLIGEKKPKPSLRETYQTALNWALEVVRVPQVWADEQASEAYLERSNGLAAYAAWAEHLLRDEDLTTAEEAVLRQRHQVHNDAVGMVAEGRWYASVFLNEMGNGVDEYAHRDTVEELFHAAACYAGEHALMWKLWDLAGGIDNPQAYVPFADPAVRRQMVRIILQAREKDAQAAEHIEQALAKWNGA